MTEASKIRTLIAMGTRPEIIKLAPVVWAARERSELDVTVCHSGQHTDLAEPMLSYFEVAPDIELKLHNEKPDLPNLFANCIARFRDVIRELQPHVVVVQGDTATTAAIATCCFLSGNIDVVHVEAGLRTGSLRSPWPEEYNRRVATLSSSLHCAPTRLAQDALLAEGVREKDVVVTGNPVVDALQWTLRRENIDTEVEKQQVVITAHRRENFGKPMESVCNAILQLADNFPDHEFHFVTHPNPQAGPIVRKILEGKSRVKLASAMSYPQFVGLLSGSRLVISDSGGIQEESPTLGVPLLITRDCTERPEVIHAGAAKLVGTDSELIVKEATRVLADGDNRQKMSVLNNPFGNGDSGKKIVDLVLERVNIA